MSNQNKSEPLVVKVNPAEPGPLVKIALNHGIEEKYAKAYAEIAAGNPGGLTVLCLLHKKDPAYKSIHAIMDLGLDGEQIWVGYKYVCKQDIDEFAKALLRTGTGLIDAINKFCRR